MIREGKYSEAIGHVKRVEGDMRAFNTVGVALMMQGEFEQAMPWFEKAVEGYDLEAAKRNRDAINAEYIYEQQQKAALEEYLNKYE